MKYVALLWVLSGFLVWARYQAKFFRGHPYQTAGWLLIAVILGPFSFLISEV